MKRAVAFLPLALAMGLAYLAYLDPANASRWTALMSMCR